MTETAPPPAPQKKPKGLAIDRRTWPLVRRLLGDYMRPHIATVAIAVAFMIAVALCTAALAKFMEPVIDGAMKGGDMRTLWITALTVMAIFVVKGLAHFGQEVLMNYVGNRIVGDIHGTMFERVMRADLAFFHNTPAGRLMSAFLSDVNKMRVVFSDIMTGLGRDTLSVIFLVGLMFYQDWKLAFLTFFIFPAAAYPILRLGRKMRKVSANTQAETAQFTTLLDESFGGARQVKAYGMEAYETGRFKAVVEKIVRLSRRAIRTRATSDPILEVMAGLAIVLVLIYGGWQVIAHGKTPGSFFAFITALLLAYEPVRKLARLNTNLQDALAATERVFTLLDLKPTILDKPAAQPLAVKQGAVRLEQVRFGYPGGAAALNGVTIDVPAGKTVALVGPSGAGKTTVLNLIPRFYDVDEGRVTIDGQDIRDVTMASLRGAIGLVSQETLLFDDTIRANIAYGRPGASEAEIAEAARRAAAHDFIAALPQGYDSHVGGLGAKLSGGQRQRIAIARAILKNAPILLLDEATSALDTESERQVQAALRELMKGRTTIVIAHRLSTVIDADTIYAMEGGQVREAGTHRELLAKRGLYASLYAAQGEAAPAEPVALARRA